MRPNRQLAGALALLTFALAAAGETLVLRHVAGGLGLALLPLAAVVGLLAWLALGAPVRRRDIEIR